MRSAALLCLLVFPALFAGCGSSPAGTDPNPPGTIPPKSALPVLDGNWEFIATYPTNAVFPAQLPTPVANFTGALQSSGGKVTGTLRALALPASTACVGIFTDLPASGTLDGAGNLTLSIAVSGGTATITTALAGNLQTKTPGSWIITGGPCAMPSTAIQAQQFAPFTGTYSGAFNQIDLTTAQPVPGTSVAVTAPVSQSSLPDANGQFQFTGTVAISGSCTGAISITQGIVAGNGVDSPAFDALAQHPIPPIFGGALNGSASALIGHFTLLPACANKPYEGVLTRQ